MHTNTKTRVKFSHPLADINIKPNADIKTDKLISLIKLAFDSYVEVERVPGELIHSETKQRHGDYYGTPGYYLRLYRNRADLTQTVLAKKLSIHQHHLSEMENNKRPIGKNAAKKIAEILNIDYRRLL